PIEAPETVVAAAVATPIVVFLVLVWALHAPLTGDRLNHGVAIGLAGATIGLIAAATAWGLPLPWAVLGMSLPLAALVASGVIEGHREHIRAQNA
ncbi:MAG: low temperature requirement protein A, partial [Jiangellaceae bacterium]